MQVLIELVQDFILKNIPEWYPINSQSKFPSTMHKTNIALILKPEWDKF